MRVGARCGDAGGTFGDDVVVGASAKLTGVPTSRQRERAQAAQSSWQDDDAGFTSMSTANVSSQVQLMYFNNDYKT